MGKLHEILAVDRDLENVAKKVVEEAIVTFTKKTEHFQGSHKRLEMFDETRKQEEEGQEEFKSLTTTVKDKLLYVSDHFIRHLDCLAQKETTNQTAFADVEINGDKVLADVPATLLLGLETKLTMLRKLYEDILTLEPHVEWEEDLKQGEGVWKAKHDIIRHKTEKVVKPVVLYQATKEHPAQVKESSADVPVGNYIEIRWSGKISAAKKSQLLNRIDTLIAEVKKARQRANSVDVVEKNVGKQIFDYIHKDL